MIARCLVQSLVLLLSVLTISLHICLLQAPLYMISLAMQLLTLDSVPQLYCQFPAPCLSLKTTNFFRTNAVSASCMSHKTDLNTQWEFKTPKGGLQQCAGAGMYGLQETIAKY